MSRRRLDQRLVEDGLAESPERALALILAGKVLVDDQPVTKAGTPIAERAQLRIRGRTDDWVSRGAHKLLPALTEWSVDPGGRTCLDVGASTGGFTQVLLKRGAARVYAVDVGHSQLAWPIRSNPDVVVLERTNARYLTSEHVPEPVSLVVCDVSFISVTAIFPAVVPLCTPGADLLVMVKPQFEVPRGRLGKGGVVRDESLRLETIERVSGLLCRDLGLEELARRDNDLRGPKGNLETFVWLRVPALL